MKMKLRLSKGKWFLMLLIIMPIIDTISGLMYGSFNLGQIYRMFFFLYLSILMFLLGTKEVACFIICMSFVVIFQIVTGLSYGMANLQQVFKLFIPMEMVMIYAIQKSKKIVKKEDIEKVIDGWAILYPLTILVPYVLGMNVSSYDGSIGVKGFYYATNEISFVLCAITMCKIVQFVKENDLKNLVLVGLNCLCLILLGTKSGYMTVGMFLIAYFVYVNRNSRQKYSEVTRRLGYVILALIGVFLVWNIFSEEINALIQRWLWLGANSSNSTMDFLTSNRIRRVSVGFDEWLNTKWWFPFIGWGLGGETVGYTNTEMDFLDLLLRMGIMGFLYVMTFYLLMIRGNIRFDFWNSCMMGMMVIIICFAGHVLFYGSSGMAMGVLLIFCMTRSKREECIYGK